ncbi:MAG TPA: hypothetical protein DEF35_00520 [Paenibacillus sp.]|nr:hypothetical protein CA599_07155 [Paenibacillus taichungensis]HBU80115.1 hypothetical protein [Paenibacillus sp.]
MGEGHGTREALGSAARKNSPVYGERHVEKVGSGTRETLNFKTYYTWRPRKIRDVGFMRYMTRFTEKIFFGKHGNRSRRVVASME